MASDAWLFSGRLGAPTFRRLGVFASEYGGRYLTAGQGDGATLAFSWVEVVEEPEDDCICFWAVRGGGVERIVEGRRQQIFGAPPSALLAASLGRIALAPASPTYTGSPFPSAAPNGPVEVRDAATGTLLTSVSPPGTVRALALSGSRLAALVHGAGDKRIDVWDVPSGALLRSILLPDRAVPDIDLAGRRLVWRTRRAIYVLDVTTGASKFLYRTDLPPVGLSIEGRRVAWAGGRLVRAIELPPT